VATDGRQGRQLRGDRLSKQLAQEKYLEARAAGATNREAMAAAGRDLKTLEYWRKTDPDFKARADAQTEQMRDRPTDPRSIDFPEFCEKYLGQRLFYHQLQWYDLLEGRDPRDLHPEMTYEKANPRFLLVNTPVHHAKSATISVNYAIYRICMDPSVRIKVVSKTLAKAREILHSIKTVLTSPQYAALQRDFGPAGGWKETSDAWRTDYIYLERDGKERDPTVEALGIGGQIYGARANLIILDDCVTGSNAHEWEKQLTWINREVRSRLGRTGKLLVVGTRIAAIDLYKELRNGENFARGVSPWTYFAQPAVLQWAEDPKDWVTLWPKSNQTIEDGADEVEPDENGLYPAWDGPALDEARGSITEADWALVYMQQDITVDAVFPRHAVHGSCGMRAVGPLVAGAAGHRERGMDGMFVIASMDPSGSKQSAFVVVAIDRETRKRYVLDCRTLSPWNWTQVAELVEDWTERYGVDLWVSEKNMYHASLRHNERISLYLQNRGVRMVEHYTGANKLDVDTGVMSLAPLFGSWEPRGDGRGWQKTLEPLIELPRRKGNHHVQMLTEQLITWQPQAPKTQKTDLVMALWFAELKARELIQPNAGRTHHAPNRFASPRRVANRVVVNLRDVRAAG
jgi:hypothetical protein